MYKRTDKLAFLGVTNASTTTYHRMKSFTEISQSKNAKEYTRQYVDEDMERSEVVRFSPSISYKFDRDADNAVHTVLSEIADNEKLGSAAEVSLLIVDLNKEGTPSGSFLAVERKFSVVPNQEGDSNDAYTYSGTFKASGKKVDGTATTTDEWETCTFTQAS